MPISRPPLVSIARPKCIFFPGVDTDKYNYPIGSGRVTFNNAKSCMKAVSAAFIEIRTQKFSKKVIMLKPLLCKKYSGVSITRPFFLIQIGSTKYSIQLNHSYMLACIRKIQEWAWIFWVEFVQLTNHGIRGLVIRSSC